MLKNSEEQVSKRFDKLALIITKIVSGMNSEPLRNKTLYSNEIE